MLKIVNECSIYRNNLYLRQYIKQYIMKYNIP